MCGICGHIDLVNRPVPEDRIRGMCAALAARGPDDAGLHLDGVPAAGLHVGLGHRRLSIIDLSPAASQPMTNEDGTIRLTYNGEIYNYKELRRELEAKGHRFRSDSDTEVVVHLYEEEGVEAVRRLNGMFAFGLWDERRRRLWLCRDRIGIKPLVYSWDGGRLLFASEIRALLTDPAVDRTLDREALMLYLAFNYVPAPRTMFAGIRKLEPGCSLVLEGGRVEVSRYWGLPDPAEEAEPADPDRLRRRLVDAPVRGRGRLHAGRRARRRLPERRGRLRHRGGADGPAVVGRRSRPSRSGSPATGCTTKPRPPAGWRRCTARSTTRFRDPPARTCWTRCPRCSARPPSPSRTLRPSRPTWWRAKPGGT